MVRRLAGLEGQHCHHGLAPFGMRAADDGHVLHIGVGREHVFHFLGVDVLAACDDHVLESVHDVEIAVLVHARQVAAAIPALVVQHGGRGLAVVQIALHHGRRAQADLTHFAGAAQAAVLEAHLQFNAGYGAAADGACLGHGFFGVEHGAQRA